MFIHPVGWPPTWFVQTLHIYIKAYRGPSPMLVPSLGLLKPRCSVVHGSRVAVAVYWNVVYCFSRVGAERDESS